MGKKKQIIHLVHFSSSPGGIEVLLPVFINAMPEWEFKGYVIRKPVTAEPSVYDSMNIPVEYGSLGNIGAMVRIFVYAYKNREHIFQVFNIGPLFLLVLRLAGVKKLIYSIHGTVYWNKGKQKFLRKIFWWLAINRKEYRFTSNSEFSRKVFLDKIDPKVNIELLYNPISLKKFNSIDKKKTDPNTIKKIIYAGRLASGKGLENWLKYAVTIHKENQGVKFEIYGEGPLRPLLQETILKNGAEDYIVLKGHLKDINEAYRGADLLLFLSEYESFGNVVVESILCGTPVIATDIPSMKEIFNNYPGFLIPSDGDQGRVIMDKLKNYPLLRDLCFEAANEFRNRFSAEQHFKKLEQIYKQFQV